MTTMDEVRQQLNRIEAEIDALLAANFTISGACVIVGGLSDISDNLGLVQAGEFRSGTGAPGYNFTGVRIGYPGFVYSSNTYNIVGVANDVMQFGLNATTGKATVGAGLITLGSDGIYFSVDDDKNKAIKWLGTVDGSTVLTNQMWATYEEDGISAGYDLAGVHLVSGIDYWGGHFYASGSRVFLHARVTDGAASYDDMGIIIERYTDAVTAKSWRGVSVTRRESGVEIGSLFRVDATCPTEALLVGVGGTETVFNDHSEDLNFRVESDGNANMLFVDGGTNQVVIGGATPQANYELTINNDVYAVGDVSALTFTDRTDYPKSLNEAYKAVKSVVGKEGKLDHDKLDPFVRAESGRNLSALVSAQAEVIKDLIARVETLEAG